VVEREEDGRWWADIESMPGVMAYDATRESAIAAALVLALRAAADCIDLGEEIPEPLAKVLFGGMSRWKSVKARQLLAALLWIGWKVASQKGSHRCVKRSGWPN
jgi:predicted RNase H-like HicB family nuclease